LSSQPLIKKSVNSGPGKNKKIYEGAGLKEFTQSSQQNKKKKKGEELEECQPEKKRKLEDGDAFGLKNSQVESGSNNGVTGQVKQGKKADPLTQTNELSSKQVKNKKKPPTDEEAIILADDDTPKIYGSFEANDVPKKLITARLDSDSGEVNCLVDWEKRVNGLKPTESFISNKVLRQKCPYLLLDFYESRLRFPAQNK
jgi:hypothetical protein